MTDTDNEIPPKVMDIYLSAEDYYAQGRQAIKDRDYRLLATTLHDYRMRVEENRAHPRIKQIRQLFKLAKALLRAPQELKGARGPDIVQEALHALQTAHDVGRTPHDGGFAAAARDFLYLRSFREKVARTLVRHAEEHPNKDNRFTLFIWAEHSVKPGSREYGKSLEGLLKYMPSHHHLDGSMLTRAEPFMASTACPQALKDNMLARLRDCEISYPPYREHVERVIAAASQPPARSFLSRKRPKPSP
ncbi:MAG: hypothetical protein WDO70_06950 [Alphaproteobacteria bacterium]